MSSASKPIIKLDFQKYLPSHFDLFRIINIVDHSFENEQSIELSKEELDWFEKEIDAIDSEVDVTPLPENKANHKDTNSLYI